MSIFFVGLRQRLLELRLSLKLYIAEVGFELLILTSPGPVAVPSCWVPRGLFDRVGSMVGKKAGWQRGQIGGMQKSSLPPTQLTLLQSHGRPCQFTPLQRCGCHCPAHTTPDTWVPPPSSHHSSHMGAFTKTTPHRHESHTGSDAPPERAVGPFCPRQCPRPVGPLKHQVPMLTQEVRGLMDQFPCPVF